jgi:3-oxoacyl-[acyl-carrier-protein] synthase-3
LGLDVVEGGMALVTGSTIPVVIAGTGGALPSRLVHTRDLIAQAFPDANEKERRTLQERTGIDTRRWIAPGDSAAALGTAALKKALDRAQVDPSELRRIIFVSSTGGDHMVPATAHDLAAALDLSDSCDAFDLSNSCVGFLSAFDVAARSVATGVGPVAVVAVETFSRQLSPEGARAFLVLGDAAAATIVRASDSGGILASCLATSDRLRGKMKMGHPGTPGAPGFHDFDARSHELAESAVACMGAAIDRVLSQSGLSMGEIDWVVLHQPNGSLFAQVVERLGIDPGRTLNVVRDTGSVGSASVPTNLDRLFRERTVRVGQRILMASVGAGTAYGAILYEVGA